jgi:septal ring-binding cell division protein DamX
VAAAPDRAKWARRAERDARRARADRRARYTVQLELVCEIASLEDAARYDRPAGSMWVAAAQHGGRTCFRVLWGRYPTLEAARRAKERVPAFFTTPRNRPAVVGIRQSLLP